MNPSFIALEEIQIARPCRADWNRMTGDEQTRFCGSCHKNVYDISQLTRAEAHHLIAEKEGDVCLRLHRRPDGTVITSDCPVGIAAAPRPLWLAVAALMALAGSGLAGCAMQTRTIGDIAVAPTAALDDRAPQTAPPAPLQAAPTAPAEAVIIRAGRILSVPMDNRAPDDTDKLGAPPMSAPTAKPAIENAPLMGEATFPASASEITVGKMARIYLPTPTPAR